MHESDRELIHACRRGDVQAWEAVLTKYRRLVFFIPQKYGLSVEDTADITQHCFIVLLQNLDHMHEDCKLGAWLSTVAERQAWRLLHRYRREDTGPDADVSEQLEQHMDPDADPAVTSQDRVEWLNQGLDQLDERCRELLIALYFEAEPVPYPEIAQRLHLRTGSIGPTRARCLEKLKQLLPNL